MSRRLRRKQKKDRQGLLIVAVCIVLIFLAGYGYIEVKSSYVERDKITNCRLDGRVSIETGLVFDTTDGYSKTQALIIKKKIGALAEDSNIDERFTVYFLNDNVGDFEPQFIVCNPGDGQDKSELTSNKRKLLNAWEENFVKKINGAVDSITEDSSADYSPIMEMLKYVSVNTMLNSPTRQKRIIVISDMLHHTNQYSHYKANMSYKSVRESYAMEVKPHLDSVDVTILYVVRPDTLKIQNRGHIAFWEDYTKSGGGLVISVETIN